MLTNFQILMILYGLSITDVLQSLYEFYVRSKTPELLTDEEKNTIAFFKRVSLMIASKAAMWTIFIISMLLTVLVLGITAPINKTIKFIKKTF